MCVCVFVFVCMHACMYVCLYVCMCVCVNVDVMCAKLALSRPLHVGIQVVWALKSKNLHAASRFRVAAPDLAAAYYNCMRNLSMHAYTHK